MHRSQLRECHYARRGYKQLLHYWARACCVLLCMSFLSSVAQTIIINLLYTPLVRRSPDALAYCGRYIVNIIIRESNISIFFIDVVVKLKMLTVAVLLLVKKLELWYWNNLNPTFF